jgi:hypothetical protein
VKFSSLNPRTFTSEKYPSDSDDVLKAREVARLLKCSNKYISLGKDLFRTYMKEKYEATNYMIKEHIWFLPLINSYKEGLLNIDGMLGGAFLRSEYNYDLDCDSLYSILAFSDEKIHEEIFDDKFDKKISSIAYKNFCSEFNKNSRYNNNCFYFMLNNRGLNCLSGFFELINNKIVSIPFFFHQSLMKFSWLIPDQKKKSDFIYEEILKYNFQEISKLKKSNKLKMKVLYFIRKILLKLNLIQVIGHKLRRKYWFKYKQEDVDYLVENIQKEKIPDFLNKDLIENIIKKIKQDSSYAYYLEQILVFCWWHGRYKFLLKN